jgi:hypothetical protein
VIHFTFRISSSGRLIAALQLRLSITLFLHPGRVSRTFYGSDQKIKATIHGQVNFANLICIPGGHEHSADCGHSGYERPGRRG